MKAVYKNVHFNGHKKKFISTKKGYIKDKEVDKMQLSKRETQLIELSIKHGMTLTAQELAEFA
ncbi:MAG: DNA-binding protein, partial [Enterococcus sp.]|nr:DNA-binding protein [Enterococcus sp.]